MKRPSNLVRTLAAVSVIASSLVLAQAGRRCRSREP